MKSCKDTPEMTAEESLIGQAVDKMMADNPAVGIQSARIFAKTMDMVYQSSLLMSYFHGEPTTDTDGCEQNIEKIEAMMVLFIGAHLDQCKMHELPLQPFLLQYLIEKGYVK
jgi:hypothetical protein